MLSEKADGKMAKAGLIPKPTAQRVAAHRARKREAGLVEFRAWVTKKERDELCKALEKLRNQGAQNDR